MNLKQTKLLFAVAQDISNNLSTERALYEQLLEDFDGFNKTSVKALDSIVDLLDDELGDDWASWWVFEAEFGANPMEACSGQGKPLVLIDSVEKLYNVAKGLDD